MSATVVWFGSAKVRVILDFAKFSEEMITLAIQKMWRR